MNGSICALTILFIKISSYIDILSTYAIVVVQNFTNNSTKKFQQLQVIKDNKLTRNNPKSSTNLVDSVTCKFHLISPAHN